MQITYIGHSGFLVETTACYYLFDYYTGNLPILQTDKPIFVFSSHAHQDHYNPEIFTLLAAMDMQEIIAVLAKDISPKKYPQETATLTCQQVTFHQTYQLPYSTTLYTLLSTDKGVAFLLQCPDGTLYHAGDLNDWVWAGETEQYNRQMTGSYRHEIDLLREYQEQYLNGQALDYAFLPLDPRQEADYANGLLHFIQKIAVKEIYPMHFWDKPEIIKQFLQEHPEHTHIVQNNFF